MIDFASAIGILFVTAIPVWLIAKGPPRATWVLLFLIVVNAVGHFVGRVGVALHTHHIVLRGFVYLFCLTQAFLFACLLKRHFERADRKTEGVWAVTRLLSRFFQPGNRKRFYVWTVGIALLIVLYEEMFVMQSLLGLPFFQNLHR